MNTWLIVVVDGKVDELLGFSFLEIKIRFHSSVDVELNIQYLSLFVDFAKKLPARPARRSPPIT